MTVAGLGLTGVLMAGSPNGDFDRPSQGQGWHKDMRQKGEFRKDHRGRMERGHKRGERGGIMRKLNRELDLTQEQREQLRDVLKKQRQERRAERRTHRGQNKKSKGVFGGMDVSKFMSVDHFDKEAFTKVQKEISDKRKADKESRREKGMQKRAELMEKVFNILTPEQRVKLIQLSQK